MIRKRCEQCGEEFMRDRDLNQHLQDEHEITRKSKNTLGEWTCRWELSNGSQCERIFKNMTMLRKHQKDQGHWSQSESSSLEKKIMESQTMEEESLEKDAEILLSILESKEKKRKLNPTKEKTQKSRKKS